ncbi:MAG: hypothetical protein ACI3YC_03910 [Alloprevotella sp.]
MKKLIKLSLAVVLTALLSPLALQAQETTERSQRLSREQLAEKQAAFIANELKLDKDVKAKFTKTYMACQKEVWGLGPNPKRAKTTQNGQSSKSKMERSFEHSRKLLDIREKYYKKYSDFLTQEQIEKVYQSERRIMKRLAQRRHPGAKMRKPQTQSGNPQNGNK